MTDTKTCPSCAAAVPAAAAFCTSCGQPMGAAPEAPAAPPAPAAPVAPAAFPVAPPPPAADPTRVDTPGLHDATQVHEAVVPPAMPAPVPPPTAPDPLAPPASTPWSSAPSAPVPDGPATTAPWNPPANPAPPSWQQPTPPPGSATYGAAAASAAADPSQPWATQAANMPPTMWGTVAPVEAPKKGRKSVLGGLAAVAGGVLTLAGVFSGWVTLDPGGDSETVTAWSLTAGDGLLKSNDPYILVALGVAAVVLGLLLFVGAARTLVRLAAIAVGIGIVAVTALNWSSIASFITDTQASTFQADTAIGFYFAIAGGALVAIAGLLPAKKP